ncbi:ABC transporter ATP-binding protein [Salinarimonas ramus]|uniref:ABC transporter ATP-binding protein n=1 Tax=Salinarimonas ramus TaxID=690164 RepID=A0A917V4T3_9HYPH|nr:ABC transporter ATP-binding protein [Salinarimonas ramus]GGK36587.1 ABC transporter ATP-binding protein [Salinarimonas ramus]
MSALLEARGLSKRFGGVVAADAVSFSLAPGEMLAMIGPNGAGKSTTFAMVGGQLAPDSGRVLLDGADVTGLSPAALFRRGIGRTFQVAQTFATMTVCENVQMALLSAAGEVFGLWRTARARHREAALEALARVGMAQAADRPTATLAYGDVKRVELAIALAARPRVLLMDEPTAGMAAQERAELMALVRTIARERAIGVLFTEHDMGAVFAHADRILVLVRGEIVAAGAPEAVREDARVRAAYLGETGARTAAQALDARETHDGGRP